MLLFSGRKAFFGLLILAVLSSACIGSGSKIKFSQTDGLVFNDLRLLPTGLTSRDKELNLIYEIQNVGGFNIAAGAASSCSDETKVRVYEDADYGKGCRIFEVGDYIDLKLFNYDGSQQTVHDSISSVKIPPGVKLVLYEHEKHGGVPKEFTSSTSHVGDDFDEKASSLEVIGSALANSGQKVILSWFGVPGGLNDKETALAYKEISQDMLRPIPENKVPGDIARGEINFDLQSIPGIHDTSKGTARNYDFNVRLAYYYETSVFNRFTAISEDEQSLQKARGVYKETKFQSASTAGPIQIELKTQNPVVYYSGESNRADFIFILKNVGGGLVSNAPTITKDTQNKFAFVATIDGKAASCDTQNLKLFDKEALVFCTKELNSPETIEEDMPKPIEEHQINATARYYYVLDRKLQLSVQGI